MVSFPLVMNFLLEYENTVESINSYHNKLMKNNGFRYYNGHYGYHYNSWYRRYNKYNAISRRLDVHEKHYNDLLAFKNSGLLNIYPINNNLWYAFCKLPYLILYKMSSILKLTVDEMEHLIHDHKYLPISYDILKNYHNRVNKAKRCKQKFVGWTMDILRLIIKDTIDSEFIIDLDEAQVDLLKEIGNRLSIDTRIGGKKGMTKLRLVNTIKNTLTNQEIDLSYNFESICHHIEYKNPLEPVIPIIQSYMIPRDFETLIHIRNDIESINK